MGLRSLIAVAAGCAVHGCSPEPKVCAAGSVAVGDSCRPICRVITDCARGETCSDSLCVAGRPCAVDGDCNAGEMCSIVGSCAPAGERPLINGVRGDGPDGTVVGGLLISGERLWAGDVYLDDGQRTTRLEACGPGSDALLHVALPADVAPGSYALVVANQSGTCSQPLQLLRGADGADGGPDSAAQIVAKLDGLRQTDPAAIPDGTLAGLVTTLSLRAGIGSNGRRARVNGVELASGVVRGLFVAVLRRDTQAVVSGAVNGYPVNVTYSSAASDIVDLTSLLNSLGPESLVLLVSNGDVSTLAANAGLRTAVHRVGGSSGFDGLTANDSYALVGISTLGVGTGLEMISRRADTPAALSTVLVDDMPIGLGGELPP